MTSSKSQRHYSGNQAFTLVELLTVIAIMTIIATLSSGAFRHIGNLMRSYSADATLTGLLANARLEAVRGNTYVTVGFATYSSANRNFVAMITVAAKNGADLFDSTHEVVVNKSDLTGKIITFEDFMMDDAPNAGVARPELPEGAAPARLSSAHSIRVEAPEFPQSPLVFDRILRFTPSGEAIGDQSYSRLIEFGIYPLRHADQIMVAQISGLTGQSRVLKK